MFWRFVSLQDRLERHLFEAFEGHTYQVVLKHGLLRLNTLQDHCRLQSADEWCASCERERARLLKVTEARRAARETRRSQAP